MAHAAETEEHKSGKLPLVAAVPIIAGGAYLLYRKLKQVSPPAPAWDRELQTTSVPDAPAMRDVRNEPGGPLWVDDRPPEQAHMPRAQVETPVVRTDTPASHVTETPAVHTGAPSVVPGAATSSSAESPQTPSDRVEYTNEFGEKAAGIPGGGLDAPPVDPVSESEVATRFGGLIGKPIIDLLDTHLGNVEAVYYRKLRGEPEWAATTLGMVDKRRVLVPLDGATIDDNGVKISSPKSMVEESPTIGESILESEPEQGLYAHYMVRRMLPGLEGERDEDGLRLRMWAPAGTEAGGTS